MQRVDETMRALQSELRDLRRAAAELDEIKPAHERALEQVLAFLGCFLLSNACVFAWSAGGRAQSRTRRNQRFRANARGADRAARRARRARAASARDGRRAAGAVGLM